jgi:hypothetical protein
MVEHSVTAILRGKRKCNSYIKDLRVAQAACSAAAALQQLRATQTFAPRLPAGPSYRAETRARRKPITLLRVVGASAVRSAAWQRVLSLIQQPPRITRDEPPLSRRSSHHCHTLPCMSYSPALFDA